LCAPTVLPANPALHTTVLDIPIHTLILATVGAAVLLRYVWSWIRLLAEITVVPGMSVSRALGSLGRKGGRKCGSGRRRGVAVVQMLCASTSSGIGSV